MRDFARAGVLTAADVHVAQRLGVLGGEGDEAVLLAVALVVRSTALGSVVVDLADVGDTGSSTTWRASRRPAPWRRPDPPWPDDGWVERCAASPLGRRGAPRPAPGQPAVAGPYWEQEQQVADELLTRSASRPDDVDLDLLRRSLDRLFGGGAYVDPDQRTGAAVCALTRVSVLAGGPGTGKTTTVSRLLAGCASRTPRAAIALAAPTGKAAARLEEAVRPRRRPVGG